MSRTIQLQVPDTLYRALKTHATAAGMSLSDYLLMEITDLAETPTLLELRGRLHSRKPVSRQFNAVEILRKERNLRANVLTRKN